MDSGGFGLRGALQVPYLAQLVHAGSDSRFFLSGIFAALPHTLFMRFLKDAQHFFALRRKHVIGRALEHHRGLGFLVKCRIFGHIYWRQKLRKNQMSKSPITEFAGARKRPAIDNAPFKSAPPGCAGLPLAISDLRLSINCWDSPLLAWYRSKSAAEPTLRPVESAAVPAAMDPVIWPSDASP